MFRILAISDSHGDSSALRSAVELSEATGKLDAVAFLGDGARDADLLPSLTTAPCYIVRGNCDLASQSPAELVEMFGGCRTLLLHGHTWMVKHSMDELYWRARELDARLVLYGHTHIPNTTFDNGIFFINPGTCSLFHGTYAIIEISDDGKIVPHIYRL